MTPWAGLDWLIVALVLVAIAILIGAAWDAVDRRSRRREYDARRAGRAEALRWGGLR